MAGLNRTLYSQAQHAHPGLVYVHGKFTMNFDGEPDAAEGHPFTPDGLNLDRTAAGLYTLTLPGSGAMDVLAVHYDLLDTTDIISPKMVAMDESARTIDFQFVDGETQATDTDPTDGSLFFVTIVLKTRQL
jgi:hypothetical protein